MKVYFVRHGQSIFNKDKFHNKTHQFPTTPLAEAGIKQAHIVAQRFASIPVDIIYASSYTRAFHTAEIINEVIKKKILSSDLLTERKNPSSIFGRERTDPDILKIKEQIADHIHDKDWHYADEENFYDFKTRIKKFLDELPMRKYENILIVSHGYALSLLMLTMMLGDEVTPEIYTKFITFTNHTNTGISMFEYTDKKWKMLTWNDYTHLGS